MVVVGIMKNATMKGLIAFDFGSFVNSKQPSLGDDYGSRNYSSFPA